MASFYEAFERRREDEICHYGVKGMKWGTRKDYEKLGKKAGRKETEKAIKSLKSVGFGMEREIQELIDMGPEKWQKLIMKEYPTLSEEEARQMADTDYKAASVYMYSKYGIEKEKKSGAYSMVPNLERMSKEIFSGKKVPMNFTIG